MGRKIARYGWKPARPDFRDCHLAYHERLKPHERVAKLPQSMNLVSVMPEIWDQGQEGCCTGHGTASVIMRARKIHGWPYHMLSRQFLYFNGRLAEGDTDQDAGASVRDVVAGSQQYGVPAECNWQYLSTNITAMPSPTAYAAAAEWKISNYAAINTLDDMLNCLASRHPFVFGFTVYDSFESDQTAATGIMTMPGTNEQIIGGHCVAGVGYDSSREMLLCRNSWGTAWGIPSIPGHFWMPFAYATNQNLASDFWTVRY
jgi:C1A family cysteine protease